MGCGASRVEPVEPSSKAWAATLALMEEADRARQAAARAEALACYEAAGLATMDPDVLTADWEGTTKVDQGGPIFPLVSDVRQEHKPACNHAANCDPTLVPDDCVGNACCCPFDVP
eukprot:COSAG04_NODE_13389_length_608_cov_0.777996_1_plen_115_part_10